MKSGSACHCPRCCGKGGSSPTRPSRCSSTTMAGRLATDNCDTAGGPRGAKRHSGCTQLRADGRAVSGRFGSASVRGAPVPTDDDARVFHVFVEQAAIAISNAKLFNDLDADVDEADGQHRDPFRDQHLTGRSSGGP